MKKINFKINEEDFKMYSTLFWTALFSGLLTWTIIN